MYVAPPPDINKLFEGIRGDDLLRILRAPDPPTAFDEYIHWDKLRHLEPPDGLTHEEWWWKTKFQRQSGMRALPLADSVDKPFVYTLPDSVLRLLHLVDQQCSGEIAMAEVVTADDQARRHYLVNSLMEEAIRSSQLEGATTSRRVAKELLRSGREPRDRSERMIRNNYAAMCFMREDMGETLNPAAVFELHRILTEGTLDYPDAAGRVQEPGEERIAVLDRIDGSVLHQPPPADQLLGRLEALCAFANQDPTSEGFIHPVVRAIVLHFWLAYDHPFEDGNGRTARALFYWYMRKHDYWLVEYLSISRILRQAPAKYSKSFLLAETDERDTTYFLLYQLQVIERALAQLHEYLQKKVTEIRDVERQLKNASGFNHRQLALVSDALRNPDRIYTFSGHAASHDVTHETARTDLIGLADAGLFARRRVGRRYQFVPSSDFASRLREAG